MTKRFRRKIRKSRKIRKIRKRGGAPVLTINEVNFTVPNMTGVPSQFRADYVYNNGNIRGEALRLFLIHTVNEHKPGVNMNTEISNNLNENIRIIRVRGEEENVIFEGQIANWNDNEIKDFLLSLQAGDSVRIEFA